MTTDCSLEPESVPLELFTLRRTDHQLCRLIAALDGDETIFGNRTAAISHWEDVWAAALDHGVAGVLYRKLSSSERAPLEQASEQLERVERVLARDRLWFRQISRELDEVVRAFEQREVRAVVLKGVPLAERLYEEPALRPTADIDLLVDPTDAERAAACLEGLGYRRRQLRIGEIESSHAIQFSHPELATVELHRKASSRPGTELPSAALVERARLCPRSNGAAAWILAPEDELLYLAVHAARHRFLRLGWLYDIKLLVDRTPDLDRRQVILRAHEGGLARAVAVTRRVMLRRLETDPFLGGEGQVPSGFGITAASALSCLATDRSRFYSPTTGRLDKTFRVACDHTYAALLADERRLGEWLIAVRRSARR